jgi:hypothetical protein
MGEPEWKGRRAFLFYGLAVGLTCSLLLDSVYCIVARPLLTEVTLTLAAAFMTLLRTCCGVWSEKEGTFASVVVLVVVSTCCVLRCILSVLSIFDSVDNAILFLFAFFVSCLNSLVSVVGVMVYSCILSGCFVVIPRVIVPAPEPSVSSTDVPTVVGTLMRLEVVEHKSI